MVHVRRRDILTDLLHAVIGMEQYRHGFLQQRLPVGGEYSFVGAAPFDSSVAHLNLFLWNTLSNGTKASHFEGGQLQFEPPDTGSGRL